MLRRLLVLLALVLAPIGVGPAQAHQQKIAITTIAHNPRTGMIEIVHQVPVHDAEHALRFQGTKNPDIIGSEASREAFGRYVARRFLLMVNGDIVTPDYVGAEITGGSLWVYQEAPAPAGEATVRINSQIFTDVWARQENRVNIGAGTQVATLIFHAGDPPQTAALQQ
ncbi:MAG: hypothetical protein EDM03_14175 [Porphyrobacter sp. IPPAS B-1204]|nr:MAG: hypothetical protein EDM03_14175 [Porphyrobacter sp. IPPAS B-1204]